MEISDIEKLCSLARIEVSDTEKKELLDDMGSILDYVGQIQEVTADVDLTPEAGENRNIMREDIDPHDGGEYSEDILKEAPKTEGEYIKVKKVL